jgi:hypothetical protein
MAWGSGLKSAKMGIENTGKVADMPYSTGRRNMYVTNIDDGEYIRLRGVDFGKTTPQSFEICASVTGACTITLRVDGVCGSVIGKVDLTETNGYQMFTTPVQFAQGVHDLYLCFSNTSGDTRLDWWRFHP